ncbi:MAG TPA: fused MFS/spermidine synthase [Planctomycetota bacterium]|nr:fused MFS/spermidine synthase [Planctomycetota bacterium]
MSTTAPRSGVLLVAAALSGAAVMTTELTATRLFAPWFGASIFAWTNVVATVLAALSAGYLFGGRLADRSPRARTLAGVLWAAAALLGVAAAGAPFVAEALAPVAHGGDPAEDVSRLVLGSAVAAAVTFAPPMFLLGCTSPFVTRLLVDAGLHGGVAAGRALAASTAGSLVGAYLPAFVLLDRVGSRGSVLAGAAMLFAAGLLLYGGGAPRAATAGLATLFAGGVAVAATTPLVRDGGGRPVAERESAYQYVRVADWTAPDGAKFRNLSLDEGRAEFHSRKALDGGPLTSAYYDLLATLPDWIVDAERRPIDALIIGGGAGTLRGLLRALQGPRVRSVLDVEIDPAVAAFAPAFGGAPVPPDRTLAADGRVALRSSTGPFDLVVLDAYTRQIAIPAHLGTRECFAAIKARLSPRGLFAVNVSVADLESPLALALTRTLRESFDAVWAIPVEGSWNVALVAGALAPPRDVPRARGDALDPVRAEVRRRLIRLDEPPPGAPVLVDDRAPLEALARRIK